MEETSDVDFNMSSFIPSNVSFDNDFESDGCYMFTSEDLKILGFVEFWVEGVALVVLALLGLAANAISVFILNKDDLRSFFSQLLSVLILLDSLYLLFSILEAFRRNFHLASPAHTYLFPYLIFPFHSFFMTASIYMTIAMAVERYRAILFPMGIHMTLHATRRMHWRRLLKYVLPVGICAIVISIPRFFELKVVTTSSNTAAEDKDQQQHKGESNETSSLNEFGILGIEATSLRMNPLYSLYYVNITRFIFTGAGPMILLAFFYHGIYRAVRTHNTEHLLVIGASSALETEIGLRRKQENALAKLFIKVILVFLICHTPRVLINVKEMTLILIADQCHERGMQSYGIWVHVAVCFSHFLLVVNASANIVFYIWQNKTFKGHFLAMFTRKQLATTTTISRTATIRASSNQRYGNSERRKQVDVVVELHESRM